MRGAPGQPLSASGNLLVAEVLSSSSSKKLVYAVQLGESIPVIWYAVVWLSAWSCDCASIATSCFVMNDVRVSVNVESNHRYEITTRRFVHGVKSGPKYVPVASCRMLMFSVMLDVLRGAK